MKNTVVTILAAILGGAVAGFVAARAGSTSATTASDHQVAAAAPDARSAALDALDKRTAKIESALEELRMDVADKTAGAARMPVGEIDSAVERALAKRGDAAASDVASAPKKSAAKGDAKAAMEELLAGDVPWQRAQELWKQIADAGKLDDFIAQLEERAKTGGPKAKVDLGLAYLQKVFKTNDGPEKGTWAIKADKSFDDALAQDDHNWEARFQKAVSLSFWPPIFGKSAEAVKNFEILVDQQSTSPSSPAFAQTHLMLGNLYMQQGQKDKALAAWQKGLALFPDNAELQQKIASLQGQ